MQELGLPFQTAARLGVMLRSKQVSPVELVQAYLDRIDQVDPKVRAYITVCREEALASAREAEAAIAQGRHLGPLHGVPIAVKDQYNTRGLRTTMGSRIYSDHVPEEDATVVLRLRQAG
ncbi:MAG: amidase, partial [Dehalococcoidia bacterium]